MTQASDRATCNSRTLRLFRGAIVLALLILPTQDLSAAMQATPPWWNAAWGFRRVLTVTVGANTPQGTYNGYTVRIGGFNTATLVTSTQMQAGGNDLRIVRWDGAAWTDLPRHVIDINTAATDVRFMLVADIPATTASTEYYLYYGNPAAAAPPAMTSTNVYRWFDSVTVSMLGSYTQGRVHASGPGGGTPTSPASWLFNAAGGGAYDYNTTNDRNESLRPTGITERDMLTTYDIFQTGAYDQNMASGPIVRLTTDGGAPAVENAAGFYMYILADSSANPGAPYLGHGDIGQNAVANGGGLIDGASSAIGQVIVNAWHSVGLASWGAAPTNLKGWYVNAPAATGVGLFGQAASLTGSQAAGDTTAAGQGGVYVNQDIGRVRNIMIRRYTEPEPAPALGAVETVGPPPPPPSPTGPGAGNGSTETDCGCGAIRGFPSSLALLGAMLGIGLLLLRRRPA